MEGTGEVLVNGKNIVQAFPRLHDRESALWALKVTQRLDKYNVWALVEGGGVTGQAESITLALARALLVHEPALKPALRRGELEPHRALRTANEVCSRNGHLRRQTCREEEAGPPKGEKEASLGQAVIGILIFSRTLPCAGAVATQFGQICVSSTEDLPAIEVHRNPMFTSYYRLGFPNLSNKPIDLGLVLLFGFCFFRLHVSTSTGFAFPHLPRR